MMNSTLNLLPISFRKRLLIWARIRQWMVCVGITLMFMGCWGVSEYSQMTAMRNRLTQLNSAAAPIRKTSQLNHALTDRSETLTTKERSISNIQNSNLHLQILGMISQSTRHLSDKIQVINYKLEQTQKVPGSAVKDSPGTHSKEIQQKTMRLDLKGLAANDASIADFIRALEKYDYFNAVELKVVNRVELSSKMVRSYQIECTF